MKIESLKNKIALVTGGTSGIGEEVARQLLLNGAIVIINYSKDDERANNVKQELEQLGQVECIKADISNESEVIAMFNFIEQKFGKLDYLINNAGTNIDGWIESFDINDWQKVLNVNLVGKFICTKNAVSLLKKSTIPRIINISSRLGTRGMEESSSYCCAEAAIIMLTKVSAIELSKYGIRVNTVSPGMTLTPLSRKSFSDEEMKTFEEKNPCKRMGKTIDIANTILFLLSDDAEYINGENINVNGGTLLI